MWYTLVLSQVDGSNDAALCFLGHRAVHCDRRWTDQAGGWGSLYHLSVHCIQLQLQFKSAKNKVGTKEYQHIVTAKFHFVAGRFLSQTNS